MSTQSKSCGIQARPLYDLSRARPTFLGRNSLRFVLMEDGSLYDWLNDREVEEGYPTN